MVKIEELLEPGETVIKKNRWMTKYGEGAQGTLWLTNRHLIFTTSRWMKGDEGRLSPEHPDALPIPLRNIRNAEIDRSIVSRFYMILTVLTGENEKYKFKNVEQDFPTAIEQARRMMVQPSITPGRGFCPRCGSPVGPGDRFCAHCGVTLVP